MKLKALSLTLAAMMLMCATSCTSSSTSSSSSKSSSKSTSEKSSDSSSKDTSATDSSDASSKEAGTASSYSTAVLGKDNTDIKADLKVLTQRTDLIDTVFAGYIKKFQAMYPNVKISYEGITDYDGDMTTRLTSGDWGDICGIPTTVEKSELSTYFAPIASLSELADKYEFIDTKAYNDNVYGIPSTGNVQGVVYNKAVWKNAGITVLPKTPDEFIDDLSTIKAQTDSIPLYTNYAAGWALTAWDSYIGGCATGDAAFKNQILPHMSNPFAKNDKGNGPYAVYDILYRAVSQKLIEDDPTTTDWESCKPRINDGEIATMVLGSWAVPQMQQAGANPNDIGYMPFPITVDGKQYASASADYCYGINVKSSDDEKTAAALYIKFLTEQSGFAYDQGGIPIVKGEKYPDVLSAFNGVDLVVDEASLPGEEDLFTKINNDSELSLESDQTHVARIIESAETGSEKYDDIIKDWNAAWTKAQEKNKAQINK